MVSQLSLRGLALGTTDAGRDRIHRLGDHLHLRRAYLPGGQRRGSVRKQRCQRLTTEGTARHELPGVGDSGAGLGGREVQHPRQQLFRVAEASGGRDAARLQLRDRVQHYRIHHPRHRFNIADPIRQARVIALDDRVTPLVETGDYRLPRIQQCLYHVTIVAPIPDNPGTSPE